MSLNEYFLETFPCFSLLRKIHSFYLVEQGFSWIAKNICTETFWFFHVFKNCSNIFQNFHAFKIRFCENFPVPSCLRREKFSETFLNFQRKFPVHSCLEKKNSQKIYGTFKEYFLETFWFIHVLKRIYLGKIPGNFYFCKKSLSFYLVEQGFHGLQRILSQKLSGSFMSSKENFSENFWKRIFLGNFPVLSCFERNISR